MSSTNYKNKKICLKIYKNIYINKFVTIKEIKVIIRGIFILAGVIFLLGAASNADWLLSGRHIKRLRKLSRDQRRIAYIVLAVVEIAFFWFI